ncbi:MAG: pilus assembly protein PilP [Gammaproteobacteria bacterium]|nr:pilus assembly protein PilP [Rhodocyclaceae bacterium]MBU3910731.1 pilus assembly protein PilP [Gammaproteobacteria bacterium]MBU3989713.1 pilus assembly protein PilP [Gammaproteobacteria bacterium]MBU4003440.1 pilus assembly protein PilP [Gammaproteobacteria bacterium]MBU4021911.1 pilus assembly protein PilP [Gammaproteobacteria bacterium]
MRALSFFSVLILMLSGCGESQHDDIKQWMVESSRELRGQVLPLPELRPFPIVSYEAHDQIDPFSPNRVEPERKGGGGGAKPDFDRPREQLESFPLESIQFIGVVSNTKSKVKHALVQANGVVYQASKGSYMGQNFGRINEVTDIEIILKEIVQDPSGQTTDWVERRMTLQLQEGAQGKEGGK